MSKAKCFTLREVVEKQLYAMYDNEALARTDERTGATFVVVKSVKAYGEYFSFWENGVCIKDGLNFVDATRAFLGDI